MKTAVFYYQVKHKFIFNQVLCMQYWLLVLLFCPELTWKLSFHLLREKNSRLLNMENPANLLAAHSSWNAVLVFFHQLPGRVHHQSDCFCCVRLRCCFWVETAHHQSNWFALAGFGAVFDLRLFIISLIAFTSIPWYGGATGQLRRWSFPFGRRKEESVHPSTEVSTSKVVVMLRAAVVAGSRDKHSASLKILPLRCSMS